MHSYDPFVIAAGKFICTQNILGIVVTSFLQSLVLPLLSFFGIITLRVLNIDLLVQADCNKVHFAMDSFRHSPCALNKSVLL